MYQQYIEEPAEYASTMNWFISYLFFNAWTQGGYATYGVTPNNWAITSHKFSPETPQIGNFTYGNF